MRWSDYLSPEVNALAKAPMEKVREERRKGKTIYPPEPLMFSALNLTPPETVRVVIAGQDPYFNEGQANGLCFSVNPGVPFPPSLRNILNEYHTDLTYPVPESGDLSPWARSGALMLNSILSVEEGKPLSHKDFGWQAFTGAILRECAQMPQPIVFILWGAQARHLLDDIPLGEKKAVITSSHPSPLGANKKSDRISAFLGSQPFSRANRLLMEMGGKPVNWRLT